MEGPPNQRNHDKAVLDELTRALGAATDTQLRSCFPAFGELTDQIAYELHAKEVAAQRKLQEQQEAMLARLETDRREHAARAEQERAENLKPENQLRHAYEEYIFVRHCFDAHEGYLIKFVNDFEMERARDQMQQIENHLTAQRRRS